MSDRQRTSLSLPRLSIPASMLLVLAAAAALTAAPGVETARAPVTTGTVSGRIHLSSPVIRGASTGAYPSRVVRPVVPEGPPDLSNVVVFLKDAPPVEDLPVKRAEMRQQDERFVPTVIAITRGSTVDFPNFDPFFHNVFSLSGAATFDLGRYAQGEARPRRFTRAGVVKVYCHLHSQMSGVVMVFDHPYFTMAREDGEFVLPAVPAGRYTLNAWHKRAGENGVRVIVEAGRMATAALTLPFVEQ